MKKSLSEMSDSELRKHIEALEKQVYRPLWSPVNKKPDGLHEARSEKHRRINKADAEHECALAELRAKAKAAELRLQLDDLTIRGIRQSSAHELNNEREK